MKSSIIRSSFVVSASFVAVVCSTIVGCGGGSDADLGEVSGTVTLDGKPVSGIYIEFHPKGEDGSIDPAQQSSWAISDEKGHYELHYGDGSGAIVGLHSVKVSIAVVDEGTESDDPKPSIDSLPIAYSSGEAGVGVDTLATVESGSQTIDIPLSSNPEPGEQKLN